MSELDSGGVSPQPRLLRKRVKEIASSDGKRSSQFHNVLYCDIALAAFHTTHIVPMETGAFCELLLGISALFTQRTYGFSEE